SCRAASPWPAAARLPSRACCHPLAQSPSVRPARERQRIAPKHRTVLCMWLHDLRDADASCGGKAVGLARLIAAGLPVPPGFVIDDRAFRSIAGELAIDDPASVGHVLAEAAERILTAPIPRELEDEVRERVTELGHLVAVRSSATIEDTAAGAAAGVFSSRTAVPVEDVWTAIRAVWASALTPLAAAYARRRGGTIAIGVIVQEYVAGTPLVVYTRPPGQPESHEILI